MSFYRSIIAAVAAMSLTTFAFAADQQNPAQNPADQQAQQQAQPQQQAAQPMQTAANDAATPAADQAAAAKVDINKATAKDLMKVKGMTASKAKAIVSYRKKHGDFKSLDELKDVKGFKKMNEKTMKDMQDQMSAG